MLSFIIDRKKKRNVWSMAKVRCFLELFYIASIDADYLRRFNNKVLSGVI